MHSELFAKVPQQTGLTWMEKYYIHFYITILNLFSFCVKLCSDFTSNK